MNTFLLPAQSKRFIDALGALDDRDVQLVCDALCVTHKALKAFCSDNVKNTCYYALKRLTISQAITLRNHTGLNVETLWNAIRAI